MPYTTYILPNADTIDGLFKFTLYADTALGALTIPTFQTVTEIGDNEEVADDKPGTQKFPTLKLKLSEDHTNYAAGFWYKVINAALLPRLKITLNEGAGDTFYFYGEAQLEQDLYDDHALIASTFVRTGEVQFVSLIKDLDNVNVVDWLAEAYYNKTPTGLGGAGDVDNVIKFTDFVAALLSISLNATPTTGTGSVTATGTQITGSGGTLFTSEYSIGDRVMVNGGQLRKITSIPDDITIIVDTAYTTSDSGPMVKANYSATDSTFVWDGTNQDLKFKIGANVYTLDQLYIMATRLNISLVSIQSDYFNNAKAVYLGFLYGTTSLFLYIYVRNFGCIVRVYYNTSDGRHHIDLVQRGRAYATNLTFGAPKSSQVVHRQDLLVQSMRCYRRTVTTEQYWRDARYGSGVAVPPQAIQFDIDYEQAFVISANDYSSLYYVNFGTPSATAIDGIEYWDYRTAQYLLASSAYKIQEAICQYLYGRFAGLFKAITRVYSKLVGTSGATTSHTVLNPYRPTQIDDGTGSVQYEANRVTKRASKSEVEIEWIER